ncbi:inositol polyphosphate-4-phosphatase type I A-like isoform X1 [Lytechinus variegatus]|uniref:inositol polyphosphate-4-phosphatase type I A-like isoform X1 n=1 Tax=Lytechinus variegatus TaxID=7654 RepID=UPI001BB2AD89|nr:inositol polyphosphate-4-phosphatase type I A-like isoform X1 [Lytechinus variegatus]
MLNTEDRGSTWSYWRLSGIHLSPKMRFNQKELAAVGMESSKYFTKEGPLYMKVTAGGWRKKGLDYSERWCRLRGNLLFFFKDRNLLPEPQGVIVLEQCFIKEEYGEVKPHAFSLEFVGEEHNQYFAAHSTELRDEWVAAIRLASYEMLRGQLQKLRIQILARTGRDPISEGQPGVIDPGDLSDGTQNDPVLEMSISCNNLPMKPSGEEPSVYATINCMTPPDTRWLNCGQTEIIDRQCNPFFVSTVVFETSRNIAVITRLRANIYSVEDRTNQSHCPIGHAICSFKDIIAAPGNKLVLNIIGADDRPCGGTISLLLWELDQCVSPETERNFHVISQPDPISNMIIGVPPSPTTLHPPRSIHTSSSRDSISRGLYGCVCNKKYRYLNPDGKIVQVEEIMAESKLSFYIPQKMLELYLDEEKRKLKEVSVFALPSEDWDRIGRAVMAEHVTMIEQYTQSLEQLKRLQKNELRLFKKSTERNDKKLEFVPTNLHLQRLRVEEQGSKGVVYNTITFGAPCAHTMKFKHGGLRRLFQQYADEQSRLVGNNHCLSSQAADVLTRVSELREKVDQCCKDVSLAAKYKDVTTMKHMTQALYEQINIFCREVTLLLEQCVVPALQKTHGSYQDATKAEGKSDRKHHKSHHHPVSSDNGSAGNSRNSSISVSSPPQRSSILSSSSGSTVPSTSVSNGSYEDWELNGLCLPGKACPNREGVPSWDCMCKKIEDSVSMLQQVVEMLPESANAEERMVAVDPGLQSLNEALIKLQEQAKFSVGFQRLQEEYKNLDFLQNLQNRRDLVFSQVITSLIVGVVTQLKENLNNRGYLKQLCKLGFLAHFESLLSTYGDEMGMLEDMSASIKDLQGVTFKLIASKSEDDKPLISGSRCNVVVEIPLDINTLTKLPDDLGRGQIIKVTPVLFTVGINEEQSLAELFGDTSLQESINKENMHKLDVYFDRYLRLIQVEDRPHSTSTLSIELLMTSLRHHVQSKRQKNVEILHYSRQLVRRINGIRYMSCKSAKDRTGMSVTLEQCQLLQDEHKMEPHMFVHLLNTMRSEGTRRDNSRKNTGINKYAFNKMQLRAFPKLYRPPEGTYGKTVAT